MNKNLLLVLAGILILIGIIKPDFSSLYCESRGSSVVSVEKPTNSKVLEACSKVIDALKDGPSSRKSDGLRLASLYSDMATLISLDGEDQVINSTEEIRQANKIAGILLQLDIKGKYPDLAEAAKRVVVASVGDSDVLLDDKLRTGAVNGFKALAWACKEGSK